jgi:hypothetical protein
MTTLSTLIKATGAVSYNLSHSVAEAKCFHDKSKIKFRSRLDTEQHRYSRETMEAYGQKKCYVRLSENALSI